MPFEPCEQSSPGEPGTVVVAGPPFSVPGLASAADAPMPATKRPTSARAFAAWLRNFAITFSILFAGERGHFPRRS